LVFILGVLLFVVIFPEVFVAGGCFKKAVIGGFTWWQGAGSTGCNACCGETIGLLILSQVTT